MRGGPRRGLLLGLLLLVACCGWSLRAPTVEEAVSSEARQEFESALVDPQSAWRLRRVALAIATRHLAQADGFASFPASAPTTELPLFDELLALAARATSAGGVGGPDEGVDEAGLTRFLRFVGPLLGLAWLAALFLMLRRSARVGRSAALGALAVVVASPLVLRAFAPGSLWIEAFVAVVLAVQLRVACAAWRTKQPLDQFTAALVAGVLGGFGLAASPAYLLPTLGLVVAWLASIGRAPAIERGDRVRAALLFWIATAAGGFLPGIGGPWSTEDGGPLVAWVDLWSWIVIAGAVAFVALAWDPSEDRRPPRIVLGSAVVALAAGGVALFVAGPEAPPAALLFAALGWDAAGPGGEAFAGAWFPLLWCLPGALAWAGCLRTGGLDALLEPARLTMACVAAFTLPAAVVHPPLALLVAVPAAFGLGLAFEHARWRRWCWGLVPLAVGWTLLELRAPAEVLRREELRDVARAGRWLAAEHPPAGAWLSTGAVHPRGLLCDPVLAPLVALHARWPCAAGGPRRNGDPTGRAGLERLLSQPGPEALVEAARRLRIEGLLLGPGSARRLARQGADPAVIEALRLGPAPMGARHIWESEGEESARRTVILWLASSPDVLPQ